MTKVRRKQRAARAAIVVNGQPLNPGQEQAWRAANADIASGELNRMKRGLAVLRRLEHECALAAESSAVREGLAETARLERDRGEEVLTSRLPELAGRIRVRTRDGLETLQRSGAIDATLYKAGMLYRDIYEASDPERDLRSCLDGLDRRGRAGEAVSEAWAERRLRLTRTLATVEAKVRLADCNGQAVRMLREVAGHARAIGAMFGGGGAQAAGKRALILALEACAAHFRLR